MRGVEVDQIYSVLGMPKTNDLGKYLGVPTVNGTLTKATHQEVIARVDRRLVSWKAKCLSTAWRATLIQATITVIPVSMIQTEKILKLVCDELDRKVRKFL